MVALYDKRGLESFAEVDKGRLRRKGATRRGVLNALRNIVEIRWYGRRSNVGIGGE